MASYLIVVNPASGRGCAQVRLESRGTVPLQLDGEPAGSLPVDVRVLPGAVLA